MPKRRNFIPAAVIAATVVMGSLGVAVPAQVASDVGGLKTLELWQARLGAGWFAITTDAPDLTAGVCIEAGGSSITVDRKGPD